MRSGASSDAGWYLIVARGREHRLIREPVIESFSAGCEVLTCTVEERMIFSAATGWRNGSRVWSVSYDGEEDPGNVVATGDLLPSSVAIREKLAAEAQADDAGDALLDPLFEIPVEIVRSITGYRYDQASPAFEGRFAWLEATDPSLFQRLFGG